MNTVSHVIHNDAQSKHSSSNIVVYRTLITQLLISRSKTFSIYVVYSHAQLLHLIWDWMQGSLVDREVPDDTCGSWTCEDTSPVE